MRSGDYADMAQRWTCYGATVGIHPMVLVHRRHRSDTPFEQRKYQERTCSRNARGISSSRHISSFGIHFSLSGQACPGICHHASSWVELRTYFAQSWVYVISVMDASSCHHPPSPGALRSALSPGLVCISTSRPTTYNVFLV